MSISAAPRSSVGPSDESLTVPATVLALGPIPLLAALVAVGADWAAHRGARSGSPVEGKHFDGQNPTTELALLALDALPPEV